MILHALLLLVVAYPPAESLRHDAAKIAGTVVDERCLRFPDVTVELRDEVADGSLVVQKRTGDDGRFSLRVAPGDYVLLLHAPSGAYHQRVIPLKIEPHGEWEQVLPLLPREGDSVRTCDGVGTVSEGITVTPKKSAAVTPETDVELEVLPVGGTRAMIALLTPGVTTDVTPSVSETDTALVIDDFDMSAPLATAYLDPLYELAPALAQRTALVVGRQAIDAAAGASPSLDITFPRLDRWTADFSGTLQPARTRSTAAPVAIPLAFRQEVEEKRVEASMGGPLLPRVQGFVSYGLRHSEGDSDPMPNLAALDEGEADARARDHLRTFGARLAGSTQKLFGAMNVLSQQKRRSGILGDLTADVFAERTAIENRADDRTLSVFFNGDLSLRNGYASLKGGRFTNDTSFRPLNAAARALPRVRDLQRQAFGRFGTGYFNDGRAFTRDSVSTKAAAYVHGYNLEAGIDWERENDRLADRLSGGEMIDDLGSGRSVRRFWSLSSDLDPEPAIDETIRADTRSAWAQAKYGSARLNFSAGLRWDRTEARGEVGPRIDYSLLQPRLGATYDVFENGRVLLSAVASRWFDQLKPDQRAGMLTRRVRASVQESRRAGHFRPDILDRLIAADDALDAPSHTELSSSIVYSRSRTTTYELILQRRQVENIVEDFVCTFEGERCIGNPGEGIMRVFPTGEAIPRAGATYEAAIAVFRSELPDPLPAIRWTLYYTLSRTRGNIDLGDRFATQEILHDPYGRPEFDFPQNVPPSGPAPDDRRHQFSATASYAVQNWVFHVVGRGSSGAPVSRYGFSDVHGRYAVILGDRGSEGRSPWLVDADAFAEYRYNLGGVVLGLSASLLNTLDSQRAIVLDQRWGFSEAASALPLPENATYLQPLSRTAPRTLVLAARLTY